MLRVTSWNLGAAQEENSLVESTQAHVCNGQKRKRVEKGSVAVGRQVEATSSAGAKQRLTGRIF